MVPVSWASMNPMNESCDIVRTGQSFRRGGGFPHAPPKKKKKKKRKINGLGGVDNDRSHGIREKDPRRSKLKAWGSHVRTRRRRKNGTNT